MAIGYITRKLKAPFNRTIMELKSMTLDEILEVVMLLLIVP